jgi:hypothetical protein
VYADATAVCVAKCQDLINLEGGPLPAAENVLAFCQAHARVSTNFVNTPCFPDVCSNGGTPLSEFNDPRRAQENVKWHDASLIGTEIRLLVDLCAAHPAAPEKDRKGFETTSVPSIRRRSA